MEAEVNEHSLDQLNTLKSQASVRLRGSILIRSSFLYKSMSPCTKIKYKRGKQKYLFLLNPRAAFEVTFSINLEKSKRCSKLCGDICSTRRTLLQLEIKKKKKKKNHNISSAPAWVSATQAKLPAEFMAAFCPLRTTQITQTHQKGLGRAGGRGGAGRAGWGVPGLLCASWAGAETGSRSSLGCVVRLCLKPRGGSKLIFCYGRFLQGKQSVVKRRQDSMLADVLYSFCLLIKGYTARTKETTLSKLVSLLCSLNWMVAPLKRRKVY